MSIEKKEKINNSGIIALYEQEKAKWEKINKEFFGIPLATFDFNDNYQASLDEYCKKYWNNPNPDFMPEIRKYLEENCDILNKMIPYDSSDSNTGYSLSEFNDYTVLGCYCNINGKIKNVNLMFLPIPLEGIGWKIYKSNYCPRGTAKRNYTSMTKCDNKVSLPGVFIFDCNSQTFTKFMDDHDDTEVLSNFVTDNSLLYIKAFCPDFKVGESNNDFIKHMLLLPDTDWHNILNYTFCDYTYFFNQIREFLNVSTVDPYSNKNINLVKVIMNCGRRKLDNSVVNSKEREDTPDCTLILNTENSIIYSLNNTRSVLFYSNQYSRMFYFSNTELFFDAFKTPTSKAAGKVRNLLDDVEIKDGIFYKNIKKKNGEIESLNMYEAYKRFFIDGDKSVKTESLSNVSKTSFYNFNEPKRIMMTSKAISQSIKIDDEINNISHELPVRVIFADFYGYNSGDGIVISDRLAKRLNSSRQEIIYISKKDLSNIKELSKYYDLNDKTCYNNSFDITLDSFIAICGYKKNDFLRYRNIRICKIDSLKNNSSNVVYGYKLFIEFNIPFVIGDKITNFHGSKGVVTNILPLEEMPYVSKSVGNFEEGYIDAIISAYSIGKRGTMGQPLEVLNSIYGINSYSELTQEMVDELNSVDIIYKGEKIKNHMFGVQHFVRFYHLSVSHSSFSPIYNEVKNLLNFGQQEKIYMSSQLEDDIMREFKLRSNKISSRKDTENELLFTKDNNIPVNTQLSINDIFYSLGYNFDIDMNNKILNIERLKLNPDIDTEIECSNNTIRTTIENGKKKIIAGFGIYDRNNFKFPYSCSCGKNNRKDVACPNCGEKAKIKRKYYIRLNNYYPSILTEYKTLPIKRNEQSVLKNLFEFKSFYYSGAIIDYSYTINFDEYDVSLFKFGWDAVDQYLTDLGYGDDILDEVWEWYKDNCIDVFFITPINTRMPIVAQDNKIIKKPINTYYEDFLAENNKIIEISKFANNAIQQFFLYNKTYAKKEKTEELLFDIMKTGRNSILNKECISQKVSGTERSTVIPNAYIDEDNVVYGLAFADSLFPEFTGLWHTPEELNYLIQKGVMELPKEIFRINDSTLENIFGKEFLEYLDANNKEDIIDHIYYLYPWRVNEYISRNFKNNCWELWNKLGKELVRIKANMWKYYINNAKSDIPYYTLNNRPPVISQLSFFSALPYFGKISTEEEMNRVEKEMKEVISDFEKTGSIDLTKSKYAESLLVEGVNYSDNVNGEVKINEDGSCEWHETSRTPFIIGERKLEAIHNIPCVDRSKDMWNIYFGDYTVTVDVGKVNPLICDGMGLDFDGDLLWSGGLWSKNSCKSSEKYMPSNNYITCSNNKIRNSLPPEISYTLRALYMSADKDPEAKKVVEKIHKMIVDNQK